MWLRSAGDRFGTSLQRQIGLQNAADAAALAGASQYPDADAAASQAKLFGTANHANHGMIIDSTDVIIGQWNSEESTFNQELIPTNAVQVFADRQEASGNPVELLFARVLGMNESEVHTSAVALIGAGTCGGVWGVDGILGSGDLWTDSYDSTEGVYGWPNLYANGDLCSAKDIMLEGDVDIYGDTMYGHGYDLTILGVSHYITGIQGEIPGSPQAPPFNTDDHSVINDNATIGLTNKGNDPFGGSPWDFEVTGNDGMPINGGTYYFTSATISGQAEVHITAPTVFYLAGPGEFTGGGLINDLQDPHALIIYADGPTLILDGSSGFHGVVIAPEAEITLTGTGTYWGTFFGKTVIAAGTTNIHVDESVVEEYFGYNVRKPILVD